jgi:hypothetical protein
VGALVVLFLLLLGVASLASPTTAKKTMPTDAVAAAPTSTTALPTTTAEPTTAPAATAAPATPPPTTRPPTTRPRATRPPANCDPAYPDNCLHDGIGDYDCAGGSGKGPNYVDGPIRVLSPDPFGLDSDHDGVGCES